jgi:DNA-binding HxlR family transcriptional regulator
MGGTPEQMGKRLRPDTVCPYYHRAVELIGRRWSGVILSAMLDGATRFSEMRDAIPDISDRMLSERLKELEGDGIVERTVIPETPVRVEYRLTAKGRALEAVVGSIQKWASVWVAGSTD